MVGGLAKRVRREHVQAARRQQPHARLQGVEPRLRHREGRPHQRVGRKHARAARRLARRVDARVDLEEHRQIEAARADVGDFRAERAGELTLHADVVVVRIGRLELVAPADDGERRRKRIGRPGHGGQRIGERDRRRGVQFDERGERRREHTALEEVALARQRVVEHAEGRPHARLAIAKRIPGKRQSGREVVLVGRHDAAWHPGIAGVDETPRCIRIHGGLLGGAEAANGVVLVDERRRQFITKAEIHREVRRDPEVVLDVAGKQPPVAILNGLPRGRARLRRQAQQEVGCGVAREPPVEGEVAVRAVDERDVHRLASHVQTELQRVPPFDPGQVVGGLPHVIHARHKWLLGIAQGRCATPEEALYRKRRQTRRQGIRIGEVDAVVLRVETTRDRRVGADPVDGDPRLVDHIRGDDVVVRDHRVLQRGQSPLVDRRNDLGRGAVGVTAHVARQQ